jgi:hypothetical protein
MLCRGERASRSGDGAAGLRWPPRFVCRALGTDRPAWQVRELGLHRRARVAPHCGPPSGSEVPGTPEAMAAGASVSAPGTRTTLSSEDDEGVCPDSAAGHRCSITWSALSPGQDPAPPRGPRLLRSRPYRATSLLRAYSTGPNGVPTSLAFPLPPSLRNLCQRWAQVTAASSPVLACDGAYHSVALTSGAVPPPCGSRDDRI